MPYFVIRLRERVVADGQKGVVIALGSAHNKLAHYFVRLDAERRDIWFSRDEVVPESYIKGGRKPWWRRLYLWAVRVGPKR